MSAKAIIVERLRLTPIFASDDDRNGFVVQGFREDNVSFLISGIKRINITFGGHIHGRTRIQWLRPKGMEVREEILASPIVSGKRSVAFMVSFDTMASVIVQGEPALDDNSFQGQMIQVHWNPEWIKMSPQGAKHFFFCIPNQRARQIEIDIRRSSGRY
ncbi:MAG: hypothetical protein ACXADX_08585 [Candidatus Hodarchaeales archaeon]|jgi:hypothetical protein